MGKLLLRQRLHARFDEQRQADGAQKDHDQARDLRNAARAKADTRPAAELEDELASSPELTLVKL